MIIVIIAAILMPTVMFFVGAYIYLCYYWFKQWRIRRKERQALNILMEKEQQAQRMKRVNLGL